MILMSFSSKPETDARLPLSERKFSFALNVDPKHPQVQQMQKVATAACNKWLRLGLTVP